MNNFSSLIENSKRAVRYWWLLLIIGIALFVVGILIFVYPTQSYLGMSLVFGWLMLFSGILEVVLSSANKHFITGRGWMLAGGIIEIILGIILIFNVALSAATLPIFLGFWLMLRGFSAIGLGGDMNAMEIPGSGWTVFSGILLDSVPAAGIRYHGRRDLGRHFAALRRHRRLFAFDPAAAGAPMSRQPLIFPYAVKSASPYKPLAPRGFFCSPPPHRELCRPQTATATQKKVHTGSPSLEGLPFPTPRHTNPSRRRNRCNRKRHKP